MRTHSPASSSTAARAAALLTLASLAACGDAASAESGADPHLGACLVRIAQASLQQCQEVVVYRGASGAQSLRAACDAQGGTYLAACPAADRAGRCTLDNEASRQVLHFYGPTTAEVVRALCASSGGTFEAL